MQLTTALQKYAICVLFGMLAGAVISGLFFTKEISKLKEVPEEENVRAANGHSLEVGQGFILYSVGIVG